MFEAMRDINHSIDASIFERGKANQAGRGLFVERGRYGSAGKQGLGELSGRSEVRRGGGMREEAYGGGERQSGVMSPSGGQAAALQKS